MTIDLREIRNEQRRDIQKEMRRLGKQFQKEGSSARPLFGSPGESMHKTKGR
ncbi:MAG: hypothetical protein IMZ43_06505 [Thermoplasmata archaeon]|nr:hypothetical protein [Thermoplasmata archaeon]